MTTEVTQQGSYIRAAKPHSPTSLPLANTILLQQYGKISLTAAHRPLPLLSWHTCFEVLGFLPHARQIPSCCQHHLCHQLHPAALQEGLPGKGLAWWGRSHGGNSPTPLTILPFSGRRRLCPAAAQGCPLFPSVYAPELHTRLIFRFQTHSVP